MCREDLPVAFRQEAGGSPVKRFLLQLIAGIAAFTVCIKFTPLGMLLSLLAAVTLVIGVHSLLKVADRRKQEGAAGFTQDQRAADAVAREGMEKLRQMSNQARMIANNDVAAKIREICRIGVRIFDDIKKNPAAIKKVKQFNNYYLDTTKKIIDQYVALSGKKDITPEIDETLKKIEEMLDSVKETFEKQLANLVEDDLLDLNAEITVMKKTMKLDG